MPDPVIVRAVAAGDRLQRRPIQQPRTASSCRSPAGTPRIRRRVVFTPTTDPATGRVTSLRWEFPGWDLAPGSVVSVGFDAVLAPGVTAGQVIENRAGASGDRPDLTCNLTGVPDARSGRRRSGVRRRPLLHLRRRRADDGRATPSAADEVGRRRRVARAGSTVVDRRACCRVGDHVLSACSPSPARTYTRYPVRGPRRSPAAASTSTSASPTPAPTRPPRCASSTCSRRPGDTGVILTGQRPGHAVGHESPTLPSGR